MEIIRAGKLPEDQVYEGTCGYCGAVVQCAGKELALPQRPPTLRIVARKPVLNEPHATIKCPTPGCTTSIVMRADENGILK